MVRRLIVSVPPDRREALSRLPGSGSDRPFPAGRFGRRGYCVNRNTKSPLDVVVDRADGGQIAGLLSACSFGLDVVVGGELENRRRRCDLRFRGLQDRITVRRPPGGQGRAERGPVQVIAGLSCSAALRRLTAA